MVYMAEGHAGVQTLEIGPHKVHLKGTVDDVRLAAVKRAHGDCLPSPIVRPCATTSPRVVLRSGRHKIY